MNNALYIKIGERIRYRRKQLGYTRDQLGKQVGLSAQFIADIECGRKGFTIETLLKLCNGLSSSADYIVWDKEKTSDGDNVPSLLEGVDERYMPLAEELLKIFIKTISMK